MEIPDFSGFVNEFTEEAEEHLQTLNANLMEIEQSLAKGAPKKEKIDSLFRAAHTVKGLAGMMEFQNVELLCHKMEDIFGELRQGTMEITQPVVDALFTAVDKLSRGIVAVKEIRNDKELDITDEVARLERVLARGAAAKPAQASSGPSTPMAAPAAVDLSNIPFVDDTYDIHTFNLDEKESAVLADACSAGLWVYEVGKEILGGISPEKLERLPIFKAIEETGMMIATSPPVAKIPAMEDTVNCRILFSSEKPPDEVREEFMDPVSTVVEGNETEGKPSSDGEPAIPEALPPKELSLNETLETMDDTLVAEFVKTAGENLDHLDINLLELERDPTNLALAAELHKTMRTLKGTSAIFGFSKLALLGAKLETLFEHLRAERITATDAVFECVGECVEKMKSLVDELKARKDSGLTVTGEIEKLNAMIGRVLKKPDELDALLKQAQMEHAALSSLSEEEKNILAEEHAKGLTIFEVVIGFDQEAFQFGYEPISVVPVLERIGNILVSIPLIEGVPEISGFGETPFTMGFRFLLSSKLTREDILKRFDALPKFMSVTLREVLAKELSPARPAAETAAPMAPKTKAPPQTPAASSPAPTAETGAESGDMEKKLKEKAAGTIRVDIERLDKLLNLIGELVIDRTRLDQITTDLRRAMPGSPLVAHLTHTNQFFHRHMNDIQDMIMSVRMVPIGNAFNKFPRIVRDLAKTLGKQVNLAMSGEETELDKTLIEEISDPLVHLIRNAIDHGIEPPNARLAKGKPGTGTLTLKAYHEGDMIIIEVGDDGKGMDVERIRQKAVEKGLLDPNDATLTERDILQCIFEPGFSTAETPTMVSGRGVGMDVVKKNIIKLKGLIDIHSEKDKGSRIVIRLPLTLAIVPTLMVGVRDETFAIPLSSVVESIRISRAEVREVQGREMITMRDAVLPLARLDAIFELDRKTARGKRPAEAPVLSPLRAEREGRRKRNSLFVVVIGLAEKRLGLVVDELKHQQEVVIKTLGALLREAPGISGATIMGNGKVALILDAGQIIEEAAKRDRLKPPKSATASGAI
ncbi:MAG: Hpt domain-containing protein [Nitrospinae bacterium]|nr:Hpt domain-containing protein [Nitrospinota bacterium]